MKRPLLILVTGRPGAGKTTLAGQMGRAWHLPVISRDGIKEGLVHTLGQGHDALPAGINGQATQIFFRTLAFLAEQGVSAAAEAAFQQPVWQSGLAALEDKAELVMIICRTEPQTAFDRAVQRGLADEERCYFHGSLPAEPGEYLEPNLDMKTIIVDTTSGLNPDLASLRRLIFTR